MAAWFMRCAAVVALRASMAMWMLPTRRCFVALEDQELLLSCLASFGASDSVNPVGSAPLWISSQLCERITNTFFCMLSRILMYFMDVR